MNIKTVSGGKRLLFFYEELSPPDLQIVKRQMAGRNFDPALMLGTANRCRFGCPRVIVCSPISDKGVPFPTTFWLTCPWLNRYIGAIESDGGVGELGRWIESRVSGDSIGVRSEWLLFDIDHSLARMALLPPDQVNFLRRFRPRLFDHLRRVGIGGAIYDGVSPIKVKCIHLQTASWLAFRRHPGAEWLKARGIGQDCGGAMEKLCVGREQ